MVGDTFKAENPLNFFYYTDLQILFYFFQSFKLFLPHTHTGEEMFTGSFLHYDSAVVLLSAELP